MSTFYVPGSDFGFLGSTTPTTIPFAAVTVEDAMQIQALVNYGQVVTVSLYMESHFLSDFTSRNIMGEVTGSLYPQKVVAIGVCSYSFFSRRLPIIGAHGFLGCRTRGYGITVTISYS